jgi:hypothetical protein
MNIPENPGFPNNPDRIKTPVTRKSSAVALLQIALAHAFFRLRRRILGIRQLDFGAGDPLSPRAYAFT